MLFVNSCACHSSIISFFYDLRVGNDKDLTYYLTRIGLLLRVNGSS